MCGLVTTLLRKIRQLVDEETHKAILQSGDKNGTCETHGSATKHRPVGAYIVQQGLRGFDDTAGGRWSWGPTNMGIRSYKGQECRSHTDTSWAYHSDDHWLRSISFALKPMSFTSVSRTISSLVDYFTCLVTTVGNDICIAHNSSTTWNSP